MAEEKKDHDLKKNDDKDDTEGQEVHIPYPKSIGLIIATEFCERFSYYGMRTVLSLYFKFLKYDEDLSTILFHSFVSLCYFAPILGATLADSFFGKFKTIFYLCIVYILGELVLTLGAVGDDSDGNEGIHGLPAAAISFVGLFLIAVGTGGIKPCVAPFGAEQFELPQQEPHMRKFFSWFYASINSGAMISTILTPYLRDYQCLGQTTCFPLAFGVPSALMIVALGFFVLGGIFHLYKNVMPDENILVKTAKCIWHAFKEWRSRRKNEKLESMMDYAKGRFGEEFVEDVKAFNGVLYVFLPVPIFWSLFDQQGSSWTFQATRMKSRIGSTFELLPDTIQVANAALILIFIPIFEYGIYPLLAKFNLLKTPLQRMVVGGIFAGLAFVISGFVELKLQESYPPVLTNNQMVYTFYNGFGSACDEPLNFKLNHLDGSEAYDIKFEANVPQLRQTLDNANYTIPALNYTCAEVFWEFPETKVSFYTKPEDPLEGENKEGVADYARSILFTVDSKTEKPIVYESFYPNKYEKPSDGYPFIRFLYNLKVEDSAEFIVQVPDEDEPVQVFHLNVTFIETRETFNQDGENVGDFPAASIKNTGRMNLTVTVDGDSTAIKDPDNKEEDIDFFYGGNYQIIIQTPIANKENLVNPYIFDEITKANDLSMLIQLPQYIIITAGEIMFSITTLSFAFTEAPTTMKSVMMALQNLTVAFGDIIVIILIPVLAAIFDKQAYRFFFFAGLMFVDMALMAFMTRNYQYKDKTNQALSEGK